MRWLSLLFVLWGCAPSPDHGTSLLEETAWTPSELSDPTPPPLVVSPPILGAGQPNLVFISGALPNTAVYLAVGTGPGAGPCPTPLGGQCLGMTNPLTLLPGAADAAGNASFTVPLPPTLGCGMQIVLQAIQLTVGDALLSAASTTYTVAPPTCDEVGGQNTTDVFDDGWSSGSGWVAWRYEAPSTTTVNRVEVFTGETTSTAGVAIWSHDAVNDEPEAMLARGDHSIVPTNSWQGSKLSSAVDLQQGDVYWVVWELPPDVAQFPRQSSGTLVSYKNTFDGGQTWGGPYTGHDKFKLLDCQP